MLIHLNVNMVLIYINNSDKKVIEITQQSLGPAWLNLSLRKLVSATSPTDFGKQSETLGLYKNDTQSGKFWQNC